MKNRQDIQQQCYSINAQRLSYDWKVNFDDGVMCDLMKNLKICEESYYDACEEQVRAYVRHSWILPLQVTPCNSSLFEPMIDALSNNKRRKRSVFNNQYGFKTADGNGNSYSKYPIPYYQADQTDDQKQNDLVAMFSGIMDQMQKSGSSIVREKRSIGNFMGGFGFGQSSSNKKKTDKDDGFNPMGFVDYNSKVNKDWADKFIGGGKSKKVSSKPKNNDKKEDDKTVDAKDDEPTNPIERNRKINFDFANKFSPFGRRKRSAFDNLPGMEQDKGFNNKFNPNPFTSDDTDDDKTVDAKDDEPTNPIERNRKINFDFANKFSPFGRRKRSAFDNLPGMEQDKGFNNKFNPNPFTSDDSDDKAVDAKDDEATNPIERNRKINSDFANKFSPFGRRKRSADPYDESNPDEMEDDDKLDTDDKDDDDKSVNEKQNKFSAQINKKFSDHYKKAFGSKSNATDDDDDDDSKSPFGDLDKFIKERIKEQQKKEASKNETTTKKDDDSSINLKGAKLTKKDDDADDKDADDAKDDFAKKLKKFIEDQIKKDLEKEKKKESEKEKKKDKKAKKDKKKLTERERDELERKKVGD